MVFTNLEFCSNVLFTILYYQYITSDVQDYTTCASVQHDKSSRPSVATFKSVFFIPFCVTLNIIIVRGLVFICDILSINYPLYYFNIKCCYLQSCIRRSQFEFYVRRDRGSYHYSNGILLKKSRDCLFLFW